MALTQIDDRGLKTPIDLLDNEKIRLGTGNDLEIYHSGSHSYIKDTGTGHLTLVGSRVEMNNAADTETMLKAEEDGAVSLYYNGGNPKFETLSTGAKVTGILNIIDATSDAGASNAINIGTGNDLKIYHDGSNSFIADTGTGSLITRSNQYLVYNAAGDELMIAGNENAAVELYHNGVKKFDTISTGIRAHGNEDGDCWIQWLADEGDDNDDYWGWLATTDGYFKLQNYSSGSWENAIICDGNGPVELYYDNSKKFETTSAGVLVDGTLAAKGQVTASAVPPIAIESTVDSNDFSISQYEDANGVYTLVILMKQRNVLK